MVKMRNSQNSLSCTGEYYGYLHSGHANRDSQPAATSTEGSKPSCHVQRTDQVYLTTVSRQMEKCLRNVGGVTGFISSHVQSSLCNCHLMSLEDSSVLERFLFNLIFVRGWIGN